MPASTILIHNIEDQCDDLSYCSDLLSYKYTTIHHCSIQPVEMGNIFLRKSFMYKKSSNGKLLSFIDKTLF